MVRHRKDAYKDKANLQSIEGGFIMDESILNFYSDSHEEIRKSVGTRISPDRQGFYLVTVEMILSEDPSRALNLT